MTIDPEDLATTERLGVPVKVGELPLALLRLTRLVNELLERIEKVENGGKRK